MSLSDAEFRAISASARDHYEGTLARHGPTPRGVDWESAHLQQLRFAALLRIVDLTRPFSLNDFGCGYGALLGYLTNRLEPAMVDYLGIDIAHEMIAQAQGLWGTAAQARFVVGATCPRQADYGVASGVFNVRLDHPPELWQRYVARMLDDLHATSRIGFAVNFRTAAHPGLSTAGLYETEPEIWSRFCRDRYGASTEVVADYGLREFTLLARSSHRQN